jgi:YidC/Oxa1 family membrane protein insertase
MSSIMSLIYTAISWIMLQWHSVWDFIGVGELLTTNWEWVLAIVFLVLTVRAALFPVFVKQIKSQRAMQALQPKIKALQEKHKGDRAGLQQAQMALMKEENANPLMGCLPLLIQGPIFIGVFHVLRHLKPTQPPQNRTLYGWTMQQFESASHAKLFGAPIAASIRSNNADLIAMHSTRINVVVVAAVLIAIMIVTTYLTSRQMILKTGWATDPTQLMMQRLMLYGIPVTLLVSGSIFPIGSVIYYVTTNVFSLGQQFYVLRKFPPPPMAATTGASSRPTINGKVVDRSKAASKNGAGSKNPTPAVPSKAIAPKPGAKPVNPKTGSKSAAPAAPQANAVTPKPGAKPVNPKTGSKSPAPAAPQANAVTPKPGAKPINPKKGNAAKRLSN